MGRHSRKVVVIMGYTTFLSALGAFSVGIIIGLVILYISLKINNKKEKKLEDVKYEDVKSNEEEEKKEIKPVMYTMLNGFIEITYTKLNSKVNYNVRLSDKGLDVLKNYTTIKDLWIFTQGWLEAYHHNVIFYANVEEQVPFLEALATKHFLAAVISRAYEISNTPPTKE